MDEGTNKPSSGWGCGGSFFPFLPLFIDLSLTLSLSLFFQDLVEAPLVHAGVMPASFVDSFALNLYHDGRSVNDIMASS